jgi:hypothetical protein
MTQTHSVGLLWTRGDPVAETSIRQHTQHSQETDAEIRACNPNNRMATDPLLSPRGQRDRLNIYLIISI